MVEATTQTGQAPGVYSGSVPISGSTYGPDNQAIGVTNGFFGSGNGGAINFLNINGQQ